MLSNNLYPHISPLLKRRLSPLGKRVMHQTPYLHHTIPNSLKVASTQTTARHAKPLLFGWAGAAVAALRGARALTAARGAIAAARAGTAAASRTAGSTGLRSFLRDVGHARAVQKGVREGLEAAKEVAQEIAKKVARKAR
mgnify:CR=1 FL=1